LEQDALELGSGLRAAGQWPILSPHVVDAVWAVFQSAFGPAPAPRPHLDLIYDVASDLLPRVARVDVRTLGIRVMPVLREPLCPSCADRSPADTGRPLELRTRAKPDPGTYRLRSPQDFGLPAKALANPVCGAIGPGTTLGLTSPTTAPVSGATLVRGYTGLMDLSWSGQSNSYRSSRDLAFLEGLERYAGTRRRGSAGTVTDSYVNVAPFALDPRDCGVYAPATYENDDILSPFDETRPLQWVWGYSLRDARPILVPSRLSYYGSGDRSDNFVLECSNGCASGSCLEEAILFGLLELIERDAFLLAWYGNADLPQIDIGDATAEVRSMIDRAALQGYDVRAFDNRIDLPIPVVTGLAVRRDGGPGLLSFAAGASFDPDIALTAALSEILTYIPAMAHQVDARQSELEAMASDFTLVKALRDHPALFGLPQMAVHAQRYLNPTRVVAMADLYRGWQDVRPRSRDLLDDVKYCRDLLVGAGFDVIMVDQTAPEQASAGLVNVSMIVPGLVPIDFGWARQRALLMPRMLTALRRAGMRGTDLTEAELHHVPHPFP
jgi:ribosomal protein S12 methylthiotransferase accessory factor